VPCTEYLLRFSTYELCISYHNTYEEMSIKSKFVLFCPLSDEDVSCIRLRPLSRILFEILRIFSAGSCRVLIFIKLSYGINICYFCTDTASVKILMCSDIFTGTGIKETLI